MVGGRPAMCCRRFLIGDHFLRGREAPCAPDYATGVNGIAQKGW